MAEVFHKNINFTFTIALILALCTFIVNIVGYVTPYWIVSWPRLYSPMRRLGLWTVCLNGYVHPWDSTMQSWTGCWWILSDHFIRVRFWLLPAWFVFIQLTMTVCALMDLFVVVASIAMVVIRVKTKTSNLRKGFHGRHGIKLIKTCAAFGFLNTIFIFIASVLLVAYSEDPLWMPMPKINKFSWSYGLCILSGFGSTFCALAYLFEMRSLMRDEHDPDDMPMAPKMPEAEMKESRA